MDFDDNIILMILLFLVTCSRSREKLACPSALNFVLMQRFLHEIYVFLPKIKILICLGAYSKTNSQAGDQVRTDFGGFWLQFLV